MKQRCIFFFLTVCAILTADLAITIVNKQIMTYRSRFDLHIMTLIGMGIVLIIFYVLIKNINSLSDWIIRTFVNIGRAYMGRSIGLYISIALLLAALFAGYYWAWFDKNFLAEVIEFFKGMLVKA